MAEVKYNSKRPCRWLGSLAISLGWPRASLTARYPTHCCVAIKSDNLQCDTLGSGSQASDVPSIIFFS